MTTYWRKRRTRSNGDNEDGAGIGAGVGVTGTTGVARGARSSRGATSTFSKGGAEPALEGTDAAGGTTPAGTTPRRLLTGRPAELPARRRGWRRALTASRTSASTSERLSLPAWYLRMAQAARTAFPSAAAGTYTNLLVNPHSRRRSHSLVGTDGAPPDTANTPFCQRGPRRRHPPAPTSCEGSGDRRAHPLRWPSPHPTKPQTTRPTPPQSRTPPMGAKRAQALAGAQGSQRPQRASAQARARARGTATGTRRPRMAMTSSQSAEAFLFDFLQKSSAFTLQPPI